MEKNRHGKAYRALIKRMGSDGKLGVGWPKEFGGLGFGPIEQSIFVDEAQRADVPLPAVTLQTVGPTIAAVRHRRRRSRTSSRPSSPATCTSRSATPSPRRAPTSHPCAPLPCATETRSPAITQSTGRRCSPLAAHDADYIWLACRTDPEAAKHKGISILIVDTKDPGYSWTPMILSDGAHHTNATYYNDVHVPADDARR